MDAVRGDEPARSFDLQVAGAADVAEFFVLDSVFWSRFLVPDALDPLTTPFFPGAVATLLLLLALFGRRAESGDVTVGPGAGRRSVPTTSAGGTLTGRAVAVAGYASALAFLYLMARHLVEHHRETAAFRPGPPAPSGSLLVLALVTLALVGAAEGRAFPRLARAAWKRLMESPRLARVYAAIAAFAMLMALGPRLKFFGYQGPPLPYHWIYLWVPGASALRGPFRAGILGQAFLAVVLGFGAAWLLSRLRSPGPARLAAGLLVVFMVAESTGNPLPLHDIPDPARDGLYAWIAEQPGDFGILEWPIARLMDDTAKEQWLSTYHWKQNVTGHNGRLPEDIRELHGLARQWPPAPAFLDTLRDRFPVRYVVVDLARFDRPTQRQLTEEILPGIADWWQLERAFGNRRVYRVRNGGDGRNLQRRFAGWMVRGEMIVELAEPVPAEGSWRLGATLDDEPLSPLRLLAGATEVRVPVPRRPAGRTPVWLHLGIEGPAGRTLAIESIRFQTPEGIVYP